MGKFLPTPTTSEVDKYLKLRDSLENYVLQENALDKLFFDVCPKNNNIEDILIKCCTLNDFYSTNIFSIFSVAKHILELNIDERLKNGDTALVNDIASVKIKGKELNFYSFSTKYCSHHFPLQFPIYDNYVEKCLLYFKKKEKFYNFKKIDLKNYPKFKEILTKFTDFYGLNSYNLKEIDKYLRQLGKEFFPKKY